MDNNNGAINFAVGLDNSQLATDAAKAKAQLAGIGNTATTEGSRMQNAFNSASGYIGMAAMAGVASIGLIGKAVLDTTAKFEKFGIVLRNTLGDAKGTEALAMIANFAATTPFQLDEVTAAFIKLANQGFVPTRTEMVKLGDLASSTGKSFDQLGEALLDAQTGQFERLKEFGIKASANGDKVTFSFKEQKTTVENTNSAIQGYILSLGELKGVAGANALISASLTGQISNLGDKLAAMYNQIGTDNKGILYSAVGGVSTLIENYKAVGDILTGLISVYGTYKVAVMYIAVTESMAAAAKARATAVEAAYQTLLTAGNVQMAARARGITTEVAMLELKSRAVLQVAEAERVQQAGAAKSALSNPYVLALMAVVALGYGIYKLATYQNDLEKATSKLNVQVANEKDKAADLFAELNHATASTEDWKKAKDAILTQYGTYLTEQQKELLGTKNQAIAQDAVNKGIEENISLKVKQESLDAVRNKYNEKISGSVTNLGESAKSSLGRDGSAKFNKDLKVQVELIKYEVDPVKKAKLLSDYDTLIAELKSKVMKDGGLLKGYTLTNIESYAAQVKASLIDLSSETGAINKAFTAEEVKSDIKKVDPILTTYQAQIDLIKGKKAIAEKELAALKATPGENPMKQIIAKQGEIDEYNKQLGVKEAKATIDREKEIVEAMKTASTEKLGMLAQELVALQKLKELREKIVDLALFEAKNPEPMSNQLNLPLFRATGQKVATAKPTQYAKQDLVDTSRQSAANNQKRINDLTDEENDKIKAQAKLREEVFYAAESLTGVLVKNGMLSEEQGAVINESLNGFKALASGDFVGAAMSIVSQIASMFPSQAEQFQDRIDKINVALKEQQRLIEMADRFGGERVALEKQLQLLKDKRTADGEALQRAEDKRDNKIFKLGPVYKGYVNDVKDLTAALVEDQNAIQDTEIALQDFLTGGVTENTLADVIAQGFQDGKTSVDDFATYMNDVLMDAGVEIFKGLLLDSPEMKAYMEYVKNAYTGGILSQDEKAKINQMAADIAFKFDPIWENVTGALNSAGTLDNSMKGKISAAITEDTATELVGTVNRITIDIRGILEMSKASVSHLLNIAANTLRTADNTEGVAATLKSIDTAVNKTASRI